jgi:hypothetical protein
MNLLDVVMYSTAIYVLEFAFAFGIIVFLQFDLVEVSIAVDEK